MVQSRENATLINPGTLRFERMLPGSVERVWSYLTDAKKLAAWFAGGEFDLRLGGQIWLEFDHALESRYRDLATFHGRITRLEPPFALAYAWRADGHDSEVSIELTPQGKSVLLVITHRGLGARYEAVGVASAWDAHTGVLADVLAGEKPRSFWSTHERVHRRYAATL